MNNRYGGKSREKLAALSGNRLKEDKVTAKAVYSARVVAWRE
jgi:hypothetical protein